MFEIRFQKSCAGGNVRPLTDLTTRRCHNGSDHRAGHSKCQVSEFNGNRNDHRDKGRRKLDGGNHAEFKK